MNTRFHRIQVGLIAFAFAFAWFLAKEGLSQVLADPAASVIADSVKEFSGEQGQNQWFYGYWDRTADPDDQYDPTTDFQRLKYFGTDHKNGLRNHPEFTTGDLWYLEDGGCYTSLWANGGHANTHLRTNAQTASEHWAVRRWISDVSGVFTIRGQIGKTMPWGRNWRGQCEAMIIVDGKTVFSSIMDEQSLDYALAVKLRKNSTVDFLIAPASGFGVVDFTARVERRDLTR